MNMLTNSNSALALLIIFQSYDLPRAYQHSGTLHSAHYNIAMDPDPFGNGNKEFPWDRPGGLGASGTSIKSVYFSGPVAWYQTGGLIRWMFKEGTMFREKMYLPEGQLFMIRTRTKVSDGWAFSVKQPFISLNELNKRLVWLNLSKVTSDQDTLPNLDLRVLNIPFQESFGSVWGPKGGIHPKDSNFAATDNCVTCHKNTALAVRQLDNKRHWYGHIRGDDQIFSWYPFDPKCISTNGANKKRTLDNKWHLVKFIGQKGYIQTGGFK